MQAKTKRIAMIVCFALSALAGTAFLVQLVLFLVKMGREALSFAEAVKQTVRFYAGAFAVGCLPAAGVVFAGVAIKLADTPSFRKAARGLVICELLFLLLLAAVVASMYVVMPEI